MFYLVRMLPIDPATGYAPSKDALAVARFHAKGDAVAYAIWRATTNNSRGDVFEVSKSSKTVYRAG